MEPGNKGASVAISELVKRYGSVLAVDLISLDIEPGEFITLLGPSGSGKTTTLMMIAGFEIPDSGEISIDGEAIMFKPAYKRGIGMVFQNYSLFPHMTVERNIWFPLLMRKVPKKDMVRRTREVLDLVKLPGYEGRYPRQLSGGQQQRIALARALVFNPHLLLMDEPLGALDKKLREHMQLEIKQITQSLKITVIYVTHDQSEAMTMSDRIAVMNEGRIEQVGPPGEVYDHPRNHFVADFIGQSNFVEGVLEKTEGEVSYFVGQGAVRFETTSNREKRTGETAHLVIRPEKVSFVSEGQRFSNQFEASIQELHYLGDMTVYQTRLLRNGLKLTIYQQNKDINPDVRIGHRVMVGWNFKDSCIV